MNGALGEDYWAVGGLIGERIWRVLQAMEGGA